MVTLIGPNRGLKNRGVNPRLTVVSLVNTGTVTYEMKLNELVARPPILLLPFLRKVPVMRGNTIAFAVAMTAKITPINALE